MTYSTISRQRSKTQHDIVVNPALQNIPEEYKYTNGGEGHPRERFLQATHSFIFPGQAEERTVWIFATETFLSLLISASLVHFDGTFRTVPNQFLQLFTCGFWCDDVKFVNCLYGLTTHKDKTTYDYIFKWIINFGATRVPPVLLQWKRTMSDQEKGLIPSIRDKLRPFLEANGMAVCYYHFTAFVPTHVTDVG